MLKINLILTAIFCFGLNLTHAQDITNTKNKDFLKNYKAPDFKQKRFDIYINGNGNSNSIGDINSNERLGQASRLTYSQYSNSQKYQGFFSNKISSNLLNSKTSGNTLFNLQAYLNSSSNNYFYVKPNFFIGAHHLLFYGYDLEKINHSFSYSQSLLSNEVAVSGGFGRLEPVHYARNAMDIERSLNKANRMTSPFSQTELKILADEITKINNVRFYDFRLRRIEQFEALDKTLRSLGHTSDFDMTYFSYLADAYLYAQNFNRFSGTRHEFGLAQTSSWLTYNSDTIPTSNNGTFSASIFYKGSIEIPASYTVQHSVDVLANVSLSSYNSGGIFTKDNGCFASAIYTLGFYPTTRTNYNVGANASISIVDDFGYSAGLFANGSFYLSPQFRLSCGLTASYGYDYFQNPFHAIWRDYGPGLNKLNISGSVTLNYAIF